MPMRPPLLRRLLLLAGSGLIAGCATSAIVAPPPPTLTGPDPVAEANLAHGQLAVLTHQRLLLDLERGNLALVHATLCERLVEDTRFLLSAVAELPAGYHLRTRRVLQQLIAEPVDCAGLRELGGQIEGALHTLGDDAAP